MSPVKSVTKPVEAKTPKEFRLHGQDETEIFCEDHKYLTIYQDSDPGADRVFVRFTLENVPALVTMIREALIQEGRPDPVPHQGF